MNNTRLTSIPPARTGAQYGFTLLEVLVAMTILALIMVSLYMAISTASTVWERQDDGITMLQRQETLARLFEDDFRDARRYSSNWKRGREHFFVGNNQAVFYVTGNGLGATRRVDNSLYFACLYFLPQEDDPKLFDLYLFKTPVPQEAFVESMHELSVSPGKDIARLDELKRGGDLFRLAHLVLPGVSEPEISFSAEEPGESLFVEDDKDLQERDPFEQSNWTNENLPLQVRMECGLGEEGSVVRLTCQIERGGES